MTQDTAKKGETIAYQVDVDGSTISSAAWDVTTGATKGTVTTLATSSSVLVSFPALGSYKIQATLTLANGEHLISTVTVKVQEP